MLLWLRRKLARRKWIVWVALLVVALAAISIALAALLPQHTLHALQSFEENSNGRQEVQQGVPSRPH
jgi:hypothetical protein